MVEMIYVSVHPNGTKRRITETVEKDNLYKRVSELMAEEKDFNTGEILVTVTVGDEGIVEYAIKKRDETNCVYGIKNTLSDEYDNDMCKKYLTCVAQNNAYKFLKIIPVVGRDAVRAWNSISNAKKEFLIEQGLSEGDTLIKVSYGRMGEEENSIWRGGSYYYSPSMFWPKYFKKMNKNYKDRSEAYFAEKLTAENVDKTKSNIRPKNDGPSARLFDQLRAFATKSVKMAKVQIPITVKIIEMSKGYLQMMRESKSVEEFNNQLIELMSTLQRPIPTGNCSGVEKMLASSTNDFARIIQREEDLIQSMEGSIDGVVRVKTGDFEDYGIEVYPATDKQKADVMRKLSDSLKPRVKNIYRVIPSHQKKKFDDYLKANGNPRVQLMWHGSRNENWMSIIQNSLQLNPNAVITGKMFGYGIYFAPSSLKSWNYTSINGSYWANGNSNTAFMGLYAVAYGKPYDVYSHSSIDYKSETLKNGCNCLHAHAGTMLKNDEIVFYDEAAVLLDYIVEFN